MDINMFIDIYVCVYIEAGVEKGKIFLKKKFVILIKVFVLNQSSLFLFRIASEMHASMECNGNLYERVAR